MGALSITKTHEEKKANFSLSHPHLIRLSVGVRVMGEKARDRLLCDQNHHIHKPKRNPQKKKKDTRVRKLAV